jgi:protein phosphatase PTC1
MVVRLDKQALMENQTNKDKAIGVEGDVTAVAGKVSEAEKILKTTKAKIAEGGSSPVGVSACNSGKGHDNDSPSAEDGDKGFVPTVIEGPVEEEPASIEDSPEVELPPTEKMQVDSPRDIVAATVTAAASTDAPPPKSA